MGGPKGKSGGKGKGAGKDSGKGKSKKGEEREAADKGKGKGSGGGGGDESSPVYTTEGRPYEATLKEVFKGTAVRLTDIDAKAVQLLDALHEAGKAESACTFLSKSLEGVAREKVANWRAYVFTLLRGYDSVVYNAMKDQRGRPRPRREKKEPSVPVVTTALKVGAPEFVPGQMWGGGLVMSPKGPTPAAATFPAAAPAAATAPAAAQAKSAEAAPAAGGGVVFSVECTTSPGESVAVVGSTKELGAWDAGGALAMKPNPYPTWKSEPLKVDGDVEYKFVVVGSDKAVRWEGIEGNRKIKAGEEPKAAKFGEA